MKHGTALSLLASLALVLVSTPAAQAAIIVTLPTVSTAGSIVITNDIAFTITAAGGVQGIALDEWVNSDGGQTSYLTTGIAPNSLTYTLNAGAPVVAPLVQFSDNLTGTVDAVTANDGLFFLSSAVSAALNDVFTLKAQTLTLAANSLPAGFNPQANQTFTGNMFLFNISGVRLSGNTSVNAVPEPSRALLLLGGMLGLMLRRRRA